MEAGELCFKTLLIVMRRFYGASGSVIYELRNEISKILISPPQTCQVCHRNEKEMCKSLIFNSFYKVMFKQMWTWEVALQLYFHFINGNTMPSFSEMRWWRDGSILIPILPLIDLLQFNLDEEEADWALLTRTKRSKNRNPKIRLSKFIYRS